MSIESVINIWPSSPDFSPLQSRNTKVRKIVIGDSPTGRADAPCLEVKDELPAFDVDFPNLTQLYLWSTSVLQTLPALPSETKVVEIRRSLELNSIEALPTNLESLVIEDCETLDQLPDLSGLRFDRLKTLSLARCAKIPADWIRHLISAAPSMQFLDLSGCTQIVSLPPRLPFKLDRLELNNCTELTHLPDLPLKLRRLGLNGARAIKQLPELPKHIDFIDLQRTESLSKLPPLPEPDLTRNQEVSADGLVRGTLPRTLFLYGSGVLEPPASEHGLSTDVNVATETRDYFEDLRLVDRGKVLRSKLLFLGNGSAGKTRLALNLNPFYINRPIDAGGHYRGSTHGIQFWDWPDFEAKADNKQKLVHLHMWDFGGQEIYHAAHRNFIRQGSVFIVLWNPKQDGQQPPAHEEDVWYPLRYWLDLIHLECPHRYPPIAIVCTHQGSEWPSRRQHREQELRSLVGNEYATDRIKLFILDSQSGDGVGERQQLLDWLQAAVHKLVDAQGTAVPTHWEIAQNMVEPWLPQPEKTPPPITTQYGAPALVPQTTHKTLLQSEFQDEFHAAIQRQIDSVDTVTNYDLLRRCYAKSDFLTEKRLHRTLRFLTHSGWLYWKEDIEDGRVIVNQRWALDAAYEVLQRKKNSSIRKNLLAAGGKFTFRDLQQWCWDCGTLEQSNQPLILSFMTSIGVCFPLSRQFSWHNHASDTQIYISPTHLPPSEQLCTEFNLQNKNCVEVNVPSSKLHRGHWFTMLREVCREHGELATYTRDACLISHATHDSDRQSCLSLLRFKLVDETSGMGGSILIRVAGHEAAEVLDSMKSFVAKYLPRDVGNADAGNSLYCKIDDTHNTNKLTRESETGESNMSTGSKSPKARVFISHSSADKAFVRKLVKDLEAADLPVWFDEQQIAVGDSIVGKINDGLSNSLYMVAVLSKASVASGWVQNELNYATMQAATNKSVVILPVLLDDCEIPPLLLDRLYADFRKDYAVGLSKLLDVLLQEKITVQSVESKAGPLALPVATRSTCAERLSSLRLAELQKVLDKFSRPEIAAVWFGVLESDMDDDLPRSEKIECIVKLLDRVRKQEKMLILIEELCHRRPNAHL